jgi:peptidoglycan hydrolase CwlO-like protein
MNIKSNVVCIIQERNELHANKTQLMHDISSLTNELEMCRRELDASKAKVKRSKMK